MKKIIFILSTFIFLAACQETTTSEKNHSTETTTANSEKAERDAEKATLKEEVSALEKKMLKIQDATKDPETAALLVSKSEEFAKKFPYDSTAAKVLFRAGDVARGMGKPEKAIKIWEQVFLNYPRTTIAAEALFAQGFTADVDLKNKSFAAKCYRTFLSKYPRHEHYKQVELLLSVIEKSPEDLIKEFQKKN